MSTLARATISAPPLPTRMTAAPAHPTAQEVLQRYPPGTLVQGLVWKVVVDLGRAWIDIAAGDGAGWVAGGAVASRDVGTLGVLRINQALQRGQQVTGISKGVVQRPDGPQVQVALPDLRVPTIERQLHSAGVVPGAHFTGRVRKALGNKALLVELLPGIAGVLETHNRNLLRRSPGQTIGVVIDTARQHPTNPGKASIRLVLHEATTSPMPEPVTTAPAPATRGLLGLSCYRSTSLC